MRGDIPHGHQAAQLIHAADDSSPGNLPRGTFAYALVARDEDHLEGISEALFRAGIRHSLVIESDGRYSGQLMAIGVVPCKKEDVYRVLSSLPLLR